VFTHCSICAFITAVSVTIYDYVTFSLICTAHCIGNNRFVSILSEDKDQVLCKMERNSFVKHSCYKKCSRLCQLFFFLVCYVVVYLI